MCGKRFPKLFHPHTTANENRYLLYKKSKEISWSNARNNELLLDNSWVILYNFYFLHKCNCHINFGVCTIIDKVKYLFKYFHKNNDCATVSLEDRNNKVKCYLSGQFIRSMEALWHIIRFWCHLGSSPITQLPVHKKSKELYPCLDDATPEEQKKIRLRKRSILEAWFAYKCKHYDREELLYSDFLNKYLYIGKSEK